MAANREYKSSVFSLLFGEEQTLRELYETLEGAELPPDTPVVINTLEDAVFREQINDLSAVFGGKVLVLIEHQSTINPNMPLRLLSYITRLYEKITAGTKSVLHGKKMLRIPYPEIIVLYNGVEPFPDRAVMRLSDSFEDVSALGLPGGTPPDLELIAHVYNINVGHNADFLKRNATLRGYAVFVNKVREFDRELLAGRAAKSLSQEERGEIARSAMERAVKWCISNNILKGFLETNGSEVINMLFAEWKLEDALVVEREEGREEGRKLAVKNLVDFGMAPAQISRALKLPVDTVIRYLDSSR
jgi:hypothetical protein